MSGARFSMRHMASNEAYGYLRGMWMSTRHVDSERGKHGLSNGTQRRQQREKGCRGQCRWLLLAFHENVVAVDAEKRVDVDVDGDAVILAAIQNTLNGSHQPKAAAAFIELSPASRSLTVSFEEGETRQMTTVKNLYEDRDSTSELESMEKSLRFLSLVKPWEVEELG